MYAWMIGGDNPEILYLSFFAIALLYSSVGFGGGSSYLAVLALYGMPYLELRSVALICNIAVVSGNTLVYYRRGLLEWGKFLPFIAAGVPLSFLGGILRLEPGLFYQILGVALLLGGFLMVGNYNRNTYSPSAFHRLKFNALLGGAIGFLSGIVGIGGGVFLAPVLHLLGWGAAHQIAALSSVFILCNGVAGLAGQSFHPEFSLSLLPVGGLVAAVLLGGYIGQRISFRYFSPMIVKQVTGVIIMLVALRVLGSH